MAKINIKTNFVDGEKLFAQQLNNNFKAIQEGMNSDNKIIWQDGEEVLFKRYATNDIESLPILDGSIIYDVDKGRHYIDYNGARIQVGSAGKEVLVQDNEPTEEDNKLWIDSDFVNTMGTEVVDSLDGNETNMSPSVRAVKENIVKRTLLWENKKPSDSFISQDITLLSDDYDELVWYYKQHVGGNYCKSLSVLKGQSIFLDLSADYGVNNAYYVGNYFRYITRNDNTSFLVSNCNVRYSSDKGVSDDAYLIPLAVYGIKYKQGGVSDEI